MMFKMGPHTCLVQSPWVHRAAKSTQNNISLEKKSLTCLIKTSQAGSGTTLRNTGIMITTMTTLHVFVTLLQTYLYLS